MGDGTRYYQNPPLRLAGTQLIVVIQFSHGRTFAPPEYPCRGRLSAYKLSSLIDMAMADVHELLPDQNLT